MGLPIPEEPVEIKDLMRLLRSELRGDGVDQDSLVAWSFNQLPKYLWKYWKDDLKGRGITWQRFLRIMKLHTIDVIGWALRGSITWSELVKRIESSVDSYSRG